ncbi:hypothetical protein [Pectobacterium brasiliense]|uniref:hypothetical protein n=1 Tax=Pectobacterium brasiliense TaxID=180957 RepID=UPI001F071CE9|nr:hypothetical protein [Pectobacterium brasiliense]
MRKYHVCDGGHSLTGEAINCVTRMHDLIREGSQFVIATHSPILMAYPDATIFLFV